MVKNNASLKEDDVMSKRISNNDNSNDLNPPDDKVNAKKPLHVKSDKKNKRKKWILLFLILILLLLILQRCGHIKFPWENTPSLIVAGDLFPDAGEAEDGHLSTMTPDQIKEQMQKIADASYFSFKINARPVFENGSSKGNLEIENPSYNVYPMVVQIVLDDTGEVIYDSGGITPNQHIDNAKLAKILKAGAYNATAYMNAYDPDTKVWQGKHIAELIITIKE